MKKSKRILKKTIYKMNKYGGTCYICGRNVQPHNTQKWNGFTLDHVVAKSKGGRKLKTACRKCNQRKAAMDIMVLKKGSVVKVDGMPYELVEDTSVFGECVNHGLNRENKSKNNCRCSDEQIKS
jgi:hypothetical protein